MKTVASLILSALLTVSCVAQTGSRTRMDKDLTQHISEILLKCQAIKLGMSRADLSKDFTTEGGLVSSTRRNYVYRRCPYVKIEVDFAKPGLPPTKFEELPTDTIVKVSNPYLQWSIAD